VQGGATFVLQGSHQGSLTVDRQAESRFATQGRPAVTAVTRWCDVAEPDGALIGSVQRELQRAAGSGRSRACLPAPPDVTG
jgi:hypothetical protein